MTRIPVDAQRLVLKGKALPDDKTLHECGITDNINTLHLMMKPGSQLLSTSSSSSIPSPITSKETREAEGKNKSTASAMSTKPAMPSLLHPKSNFWDSLNSFLHTQFEGKDADRVKKEFRAAYDNLIREEKQKGGN